MCPSAGRLVPSIGPSFPLGKRTCWACGTMSWSIPLLDIIVGSKDVGELTLSLSDLTLEKLA